MNVFSKLRDLVGLNEPVEYEYEYDELEGEQYQNVYPPEQEPPAVANEDQRRNNRRLRDRTAPGAGVVNGDSIGGVMNNVIGMPGALNGISEVMVMEPRTFEEMPQAIRALKERKSVVLNLTIMEPDQAQRAVDFVAGGTYALDGHQERIGESIFLFTPSCVQVRTQAGVIHEVTTAQGRPRVDTGAGEMPASTVWQPEPARAMQ